jgi:hypothetical protein
LDEPGALFRRGQIRFKMGQERLGEALRRGRASMTERPDREVRVPELDQTVPPRPEEEIADVRLNSDAANEDRDAN